MSQKNVVIIGAGLVGSLLSIYLRKRGYTVKIFERRGDMRKDKVAAGRSINLALSDRGLLALEAVGIAEEIKKIAIPMPGRMIHNLDGTNVYQPYGKEGQAINSVSRGLLNKRLIELAEAEGAELFFGQKCAHINWATNEVTLENTTTQERTTVKADLIFGSDGAYSAARLQHQLQHERFDYQQFYIDCGYKELTIPAVEGDGFAMEKYALHIWPRREFMLIALPNPEGSFTCTLFFPFEGETSFSTLDTRDKVQVFFEKTFPDTIALMPNLVDEYFHNPTASLVTVKCFPWIREDKFALIGDAAHAIVPFFGQGMNCGFEDCVVLNELMEQYNDNWAEILPAYQALRKPDGDAIADLALNNFIEMRDRVADPKFLLQKKIEARISEKYPDKWIPAYSQVTFSPHIRYSEALRNGQRQEAIMQEIMQLPDIESVWNSEAVEQMILSKI
jgi:kynurenine 3-monooxygenase